MPARAIKAIFFTRFHHEKGSRVLHQVPEGSITPSTSPSALSVPLFDLDAITSYLIPTQQFCDRLLTFCTNRNRIIGYPVCIREGKYSRNEFIFNFALVVEESVSDWAAYGEVARKMGRLLRDLEEQGGFLSGEEDTMGVWDEDDGVDGRVNWSVLGMDGDSGGGGSKVYALCEMILEDLNNYAECMIPIDDSNTINLKLFPTHPPPPPIHAHQVPLLTISLASLTSPVSSDLTLLRILPYINGINSVSHIAQLADTDLSLTRKAIQHLVYYGCLVLLDVFSFGAVYAPTAEIGGFITEEAVQEECARYVRVPRLQFSNSGARVSSESEQASERDGDQRSPSTASDIQSGTSVSTLNATEFDMPNTGRPSLDSAPDDFDIAHEDLITLYTSLRQGLTLKNWALENISLLSGIDIRRFITFGIVKGFLYRVHKYAVTTSTTANTHAVPPAPPASLEATPSASLHPDSDQATVRGGRPPIPTHARHRPSIVSMNVFTSGRAGTDEIVPRLDSIVTDMDTERNGDSVGFRGGLPLVRFLDGMHSFDEICMELGMSERRVEEKVKGVGDVQIFWR